MTETSGSVQMSQKGTVGFLSSLSLLFLITMYFPDLPALIAPDSDSEDESEEEDESEVVEEVVASEVVALVPPDSDSEDEDDPEKGLVHLRQALEIERINSTLGDNDLDVDSEDEDDPEKEEEVVALKDAVLDRTEGPPAHSAPSLVDHNRTYERLNNSWGDGHGRSIIRFLTFDARVIVVPSIRGASMFDRAPPVQEDDTIAGVSAQEPLDKLGHNKEDTEATPGSLEAGTKGSSPREASDSLENDDSEGREGGAQRGGDKANAEKATSASVALRTDTEVENLTQYQIFFDPFSDNVDTSTETPFIMASVFQCSQVTCVVPFTPQAQTLTFEDLPEGRLSSLFCPHAVVRSSEFVDFGTVCPKRPTMKEYTKRMTKGVTFVVERLKNLHGIVDVMMKDPKRINMKRLDIIPLCCLDDPGCACHVIFSESDDHAKDTFSRLAAGENTSNQDRTMFQISVKHAVGHPAALQLPLLVLDDPTIPSGSSAEVDNSCNWCKKLLRTQKRNKCCNTNPRMCVM